MRTGVAHLPLHGGKAPAWLFTRMVRPTYEKAIARAGVVTAPARA